MQAKHSSKRSKFMEEHEDVLSEMKIVSKRVSAAKASLKEAMLEQKLETISVDGHTFECNKKPSTKHDVELLKELVGDDKTAEYLAQITTPSTKLSSSKNKKKRKIEDQRE